MQKFVFFTMNDFQKEGGGTIRMLGIINELAKIHDDITLISNIKDPSKVAQNVKLIPVQFECSRNDKRKFQFLLGAFDYKRINRSFPALLEKLESVFQPIDPNSQFIFFEYLDNSIGYWLKKNGIINSYINDVHGIASNEFDFQAKKTQSFATKLKFRLKKMISQILDKRVFGNAKGIIYASQAMNDYFKKLYPDLKNKKNYHLPYLLNYQNVKPFDAELVEKLKEELGIEAIDFVFLFAGAYKETGGIQDLILAFEKVAAIHPQAKLILIGDGPTFEECKALIQNQKAASRIYLQGRQPYDYLSSYQELANVLVCPDRQNLFSDLIVHVKYLDALVSGKIVINGGFKSVMEINQDESLSLLFKPSDIDDLAEKMEESIVHYDALSEKFKGAKDYTLENLNYTRYISNLVEK